jgi:chloramphenicol 3-O-phosphotransferase
MAVGVICPIEILEAREQGDQVIGRARDSDVVHRFLRYDVTVDTGRSDVRACVAQVLEAVPAWRIGAQAEW